MLASGIEKKWKVPILFLALLEFGWSTVKEYLSDELASNSEDEKRIFLSERRAERRSKQVSSRRRSRAASGVGRRLNLRGFSSSRLPLDFLARLVLCM